MDLQQIREASRVYHKSATTLHQIIEHLWIHSFEVIALPKGTIEANVKVMIAIKELTPELFQSQVTKSFKIILSLKLNNYL